MDWSWVVILAPLAAFMLWLAFEAGGYYYKWQHVTQYGHPGCDRHVARVEITPQSRPHFWSTQMSKIAEGQTDALTVKAYNAANRQLLPLPDAAVVASVSGDVVSSVDLATGNFTFKAGSVDGDDSLVATVAGVASAAYVETVVADNAVSRVEIVPQAPAA